MAHLLNNSLRSARLGHSLTLTSHRFDSERKRLPAEMGGKGDEEKGNATALHQIVQARLPPISARTPRMCMCM